MIPTHRIVAVVMALAGHSHEHITHLIDDTGRYWTVAEVLRHLDYGIANFYVDDGFRRAYVGANGRAPHRWVQTHADGRWTNNLLALPRRAAA